MSMFSLNVNHKFSHPWLLWSTVVLAAHFVIGLLVVMLLNGKLVNHSLAPIFQFLGIFQLIWPDQPLQSLQFLATKSLFAFAHQDSRSGLNLWTLEYDTYTLLVFIAVSLLVGWIVNIYRQQASTIPFTAVALCVAGGFFVSLAVSYMTVIDHCSGATWVGYVALYGLGFDEFELYPAYQIICAAAGIVMLITGFIWLNSRKTSKNRKNPVTA